MVTIENTSTIDLNLNDEEKRFLQSKGFSVKVMEQLKNNQQLRESLIVDLEKIIYNKDVSLKQKLPILKILAKINSLKDKFQIANSTAYSNTKNLYEIQYQILKMYLNGELKDHSELNDFFMNLGDLIGILPKKDIRSIIDNIYDLEGGFLIIYTIFYGKLQSIFDKSEIQNILTKSVKGRNGIEIFNHVEDMKKLNFSDEDILTLLETSVGIEKKQNTKILDRYKVVFSTYFDQTPEDIFNFIDILKDLNIGKQYIYEKLKNLSETDDGNYILAKLTELKKLYTAREIENLIYNYIKSVDTVDYINIFNNVDIMISIGIEKNVVKDIITQVLSKTGYRIMRKLSILNTKGFSYSEILDIVEYSFSENEGISRLQDILNNDEETYKLLVRLNNDIQFNNLDIVINKINTFVEQHDLNMYKSDIIKRVFLNLSNLDDPDNIKSNLHWYVAEEDDNNHHGDEEEMAIAKESILEEQIALEELGNESEKHNNVKLNKDYLQPQFNDFFNQMFNKEKDIDQFFASIDDLCSSVGGKILLLPYISSIDDVEGLDYEFDYSFFEDIAESKNGGKLFEIGNILEKKLSKDEIYDLFMLATKSNNSYKAFDYVYSYIGLIGESKTYNILKEVIKNKSLNNFNMLIQALDNNKNISILVKNNLLNDMYFQKKIGGYYTLAKIDDSLTEEKISYIINTILNKKYPDMKKVFN